MRPLRFVLPHDPSMRPAWMMRMGLFLYDHLARRELLPGSDSISLAGHPAGAPLKRDFSRAFVYSDGWVDDARLVVLNAVDASRRGATVLPRTACDRVEADASGGWIASLRQADGALREVSARALVNATGQWAASFLQVSMRGTPAASKRSLRLVKGSHIVVPRMFAHDMAYILQSPDKRIVFAIPYEQDYTLVGTTDVELAGPPGDVRISPEEVSYLCGLVNRYFVKPISPADVVWSYAGVRPLLDDESGDPSAVTRDYSLEVAAAGPPLLTVWGGKITTYRKLAEEAVDRLHPALAPQVRAMGRPWTLDAPLPGGDFDALLGRRPAGQLGLDQLEALICSRHPWLPPALAARWARSYGTLFQAIVGQAASLQALGAEVAPGIFAAELSYLRNQEWARTAEDVLWRRSKLGLHLDEAGRQAVAAWLDEHVAPVTAGQA
jgi:glycerol-3-phosphate dehydrogenase